jgi:hypothetical protein
VPYPCSLNVPSLQDAGPMGDQNPIAYVHKGGVRILSYLMNAGGSGQNKCRLPLPCHQSHP